MVTFDDQVHYLGIVGGSDTAETTRAVLSRLMRSDVARNLNWAGKGGKTAFGKMELTSIICGEMLCFLFVAYTSCIGVELSVQMLEQVPVKQQP